MHGYTHRYTDTCGRQRAPELTDSPTQSGGEPGRPAGAGPVTGYREAGRA